MKEVKGYVRGNLVFPNGVLDRLIMLGGHVVEEFTEAELANPANLFAIDFYNNDTIIKIEADSVPGVIMLEFWEELQPITYIDKPESLPASWAEALESCSEAQTYNRGLAVELNQQLDVLGSLVVCRDIYRQGWTPKGNEFCYYIDYNLLTEELEIIRGVKMSKILSFQDSNLAELFLNNFRERIEFCKKMI